jgi:hypothetical protein
MPKDSEPNGSKHSLNTFLHTTFKILLLNIKIFTRFSIPILPEGTCVILNVYFKITDLYIGPT